MTNRAVLPAAGVAALAELAVSNSHAVTAGGGATCLRYDRSGPDLGKRVAGGKAPALTNSSTRMTFDVR